MKLFKIGGNIIDNEEQLKEFLLHFSKTQGPKILVHGGGKLASQLSERLGIEPKMVDGRRITDAATLDVVTMVYAGLINKKIVAILQSLFCNAIGMSGADANIIRAHKRPVGAVDYGYAGDVDKVDAGILLNLCEKGITPVICAITHDNKGQLLNTNADTIATEISIACSGMESTELIFCFEKDGVLDAEDKVINNLSHSYFNELVQQGVITDGMLPKLNNAFRALQSGTKNIRIVGPGYIEHPEQEHTLISN